MKTEALIRELVADSVRPITPLLCRLFRGALGGTAFAVVLFVGWMHARSDLSQAFRSPAFVHKLVVAALLAATAGSLLPQMARPLPASILRYSVLLIAPALLAIGVGVELWMQPTSLWLPRLVGHNAGRCLSSIPFLAAGPATGLLIALRSGAPAHPTSAGAIAGLASGAVGAMLYALTCPDDSPLFVATWYTIAIAVVMSVTACAGRQLLRW